MNKVIEIAEALERRIAEVEEENARLRAELNATREKGEDIENKFRLLVDNAPEGIFIQVDGRFAYVNEAVRKLYGAETREDLLGTYILDRIPEIYKEFVKERIYKLNVERETILKSEFSHLRLDGTTVDVEVSAVPIHYENRDGALVFVKDISERKAIENKLRRREIVLKIFVEHAPAAIAMLDKDMRYLAASQRFITDYRLKDQDIIGRSHYEIFPEIPEYWKEIHRKCLAGNIEKNENDTFIREDGRTDWLRWEIHPWYSGDNEIGGVFIFSEVITERKNAEDELKLSKEKLSLALEGADLGLWEWDILSKKILLNEQSGKILGYGTGETEFTVNDFIKLVHPDDQAITREKTLDVVEGRLDQYSVEHRMLSVNGKWKWILSRARILEKNIDGKPVRAAGTFLDITARRNAEDELRKSYDLLSNITEQVPGVVYQFRLYPDGRSAFPYSSEGMYDMFEVTPEEVRENAGKIYTRLHPEDYNIVMDAINESAQTLKLFHCEFRVILPEQGLRWRYSTAKPERLADGSVLAHGIITDITESKAIEQQLDIKIEELNTFFDCALDLLSITDISGTFTRLNKEWENVLGYSLSELENHSYLEFIHPDDLDPTKKIMKMLSDHIRVLNYTNRYRTKNGDYKWIEWNSYPLGNKIYGSARDITIHKETEEVLIKAKEKAEESDRLKTSFLQNLSHEIRTPMNAIVGFSGLIASYYDNRPKLEYFAEIINQRCNDLLDIINDILDIARIESGQVHVTLEECNLDSLFEELKSFFKEQQIKMAKQHIRFNMNSKGCSEGLIIITDKVKLKQILINLLSNAFKFTDTGKIEGGCIAEGDKIIFYVSDTGIGIHPDKHEFIFERFSQLNQGSSRLFGGTGLGLSIARGLVNLLGGKIWLKSEPGKGSVFYFTIESKTSMEYVSRVEEIDTRRETVKFSNKVVLVVEDDNYNTVLIEEILTGTGLQLLFAENGMDAISVVLHHPPDLILMDVSLPDISGYDVARQILMQDPSIKIIAQTAYASQDDRNRALSAGCVDYISKPIDSKKLISLLSKWLTG